MVTEVQSTPICKWYVWWSDPLASDFYKTILFELNLVSPSKEVVKSIPSCSSSCCWPMGYRSTPRKVSANFEASVGTYSTYGSDNVSGLHVPVQWAERYPISLLNRARSLCGGMSNPAFSFHLCRVSPDPACFSSNFILISGSLSQF